MRENICEENSLRSCVAIWPTLRGVVDSAMNMNTAVIRKACILNISRFHAGVLCCVPRLDESLSSWWTLGSDVIIGPPIAWTTSWLERSYVCQHGLPECMLQYDGWLQRSPREMKVTQQGLVHQTASCYKEKYVLMLQIYYKRILIFITFYRYLFVSSWQFCGFMGNIFSENGPLVCLREELLLLSLGS
jgi:hypothetical protein